MKRDYTVEPTWAESTWADDGGQTPSDTRRQAPDLLESAAYPSPLERLYARHTLIATGRAEGDSRPLHLAIIERLAANRQVAEEQGWTSLALERVGGMGRLQLSGVPAAAERREVVPDWSPR